MGIEHLDVSKGGYSRVTFSKNLAFFTGHAAPQYQTLKEQAEGILKRYDELFKQFGLKKSNILYTTCFMKNADDEDEFADIYFQWIDPKNPPAGVTDRAGSILLLQIMCRRYRCRQKVFLLRRDPELCKLFLIICNTHRRIIGDKYEIPVMLRQSV